MAKSWKPKVFPVYKPPKIADPFKDYMKAFKEPKIKEMHFVTFYERQVQEVLCEAIRKKRLVRFNYTDKAKNYSDWRMVEPYLIGELISTGNIVLSAWYLPTQQQQMFNDEKEGWRQYILENIDLMTVEIQAKNHNGLRPKYSPNSKTMSIIHCRVQ